jgi:hypothetical protein
MRSREYYALTAFDEQQLLPIELFESAEKDTNSPLFKTQNQP